MRTSDEKQMGDEQYEDLSANVSIITLNTDGQSTPSKRQRLAEYIKHDSPTHCAAYKKLTSISMTGLKQKRYHININERNRSGCINF